jgi:hypothetical protein
MINRKKMQQFLFIAMFFNCCLIIFITSISISTEYWVYARPYRQMFVNTILIENSQPPPAPSQSLVDLEKNTNNNSQQQAFSPGGAEPPPSVVQSDVNKTSKIIDLLDDFDFEELEDESDQDRDEDDLLPLDLYANKDCKRYNGKIRFGLFKGIWLLNYAYGCKNRINRVSSKT